MPIRPENRDRYPKNWKSEIVPRIRERSGNRCECTGQCGVDHPSLWGWPEGRCSIGNGLISYMDPAGKWHACLESERGEVMERIDGKDYRAALIVLTVMHLNHQPEDCRDENLLHACQGCHNRYDAPHRRKNAAATRRGKLASDDLFNEG